jgi:hypothetical protein
MKSHPGRGIKVPENWENGERDSGTLRINLKTTYLTYTTIILKSIKINSISGDRLKTRF